MKETLTIRLKRQKTFHFVEYHDGLRVTAPAGRHAYQTRHSDTDVCLPATILPEGQDCIVNFCGTIVTATPLNVPQETKLMYVSQDPYPLQYQQDQLHGCPKECPGLCSVCPQNKRTQNT